MLAVPEAVARASQREEVRMSSDRPTIDPQAGAVAVTPPAPGGARSDQERLHELGYAQELKRGMGAFSNFAVSFTIISILSGCLTLFGYGMLVGGPASSAFGWPRVGIMVTFVARAIAEV